MAAHTGSAAAAAAAAPADKARLRRHVFAYLDFLTTRDPETFEALATNTLAGCRLAGAGAGAGRAPSGAPGSALLPFERAPDRLLGPEAGPGTRSRTVRLAEERARQLMHLSAGPRGAAGLRPPRSGADAGGGAGGAGDPAAGGGGGGRCAAPPELQQLLAFSLQPALDELSARHADFDFSDWPRADGVYLSGPKLAPLLAPQLLTVLFADVAAGLLCPGQPPPPDTPEHAAALHALLRPAILRALIEAADGAAAQRRPAARGADEGFAFNPGLRRAAKLLLAPPPREVLDALLAAAWAAGDREGAPWRLAALLARGGGGAAEEGGAGEEGGAAEGQRREARGEAAPKFAAAAAREARRLVTASCAAGAARAAGRGSAGPGGGGSGAGDDGGGGSDDAGGGGGGAAEACALRLVLLLTRSRAAVLLHLQRASDAPGASEHAPAQAVVLVHLVECLETAAAARLKIECGGGGGGSSGGGEAAAHLSATLSRFRAVNAAAAALAAAAGGPAAAGGAHPAWALAAAALGLHAFGRDPEVVGTDPFPARLRLTPLRAGHAPQLRRTCLGVFAAHARRALAAPLRAGGGGGGAAAAGEDPGAADAVAVARGLLVLAAMRASSSGAGPSPALARPPGAPRAAADELARHLKLACGGLEVWREGLAALQEEHERVWASRQAAFYRHGDIVALRRRLALRAAAPPGFMERAGPPPDRAEAAPESSCPWCAHDGARAAAAAARRRARAGAGAGGAGAEADAGADAGGGGDPGCAYAEWPVEPESPFFWRRLWWGLLGAVNPRARTAMADEGGMCPHSRDQDLWRCVFDGVRGSLLRSDPRAAALAGLSSEHGGDSVVAAAAAAYARGLNADFAQAYQPGLVVRAARVLEALGPLGEALDPPADAVPLWPALAQQAVSAALLQSLGPDGWAHRPPPEGAGPGGGWSAGGGDETEGGHPAWPVWFHLHMLGVLGGGDGGDGGGGGGGGGDDALSPGPAAAARARAAALAAGEPLQGNGAGGGVVAGGGGGGGGRDGAGGGPAAMAQLLQEVYSDPDARLAAVDASLRAAFTPADFGRLQRQGWYPWLAAHPVAWAAHTAPRRYGEGVCDRCRVRPAAVECAVCGCAQYCSEDCLAAAAGREPVGSSKIMYAGHSAMCGLLGRGAAAAARRLAAARPPRPACAPAAAAAAPRRGGPPEPPGWDAQAGAPGVWPTQAPGLHSKPAAAAAALRAASGAHPGPKALRVAAESRYQRSI
ncbi:MAG: hypothetical protein J3K34DRAFT_483577 [Monoraphidium minutum]|nr:MAG: hypothetical protein J3K34DRAFT_483577 [Monoraphidium minutum]